MSSAWSFSGLRPLALGRAGGGPTSAQPSAPAWRAEPAAKAALNGLNLSVLDGWWEEAYDGLNGWAIESDSRLDPAEQDARDAAALYALLEDEIAPCFYDRDERGIPRDWVRRVKASLRTLAPRFGSTRMLEEYAAQAYAAD
jgi:starch phosphorylase